MDAARIELRAEEGAADLLSAVRARLSALSEWTDESTGRAVREAGGDRGLKGPRLFHPIRLAVAGARSGPDLGKLLRACGRERILERLDTALDALV